MWGKQHGSLACKGLLPSPTWTCPSVKITMIIHPSVCILFWNWGRYLSERGLFWWWHLPSSWPPATLDRSQWGEGTMSPLRRAHSQWWGRPLIYPSLSSSHWWHLRRDNKTGHVRYCRSTTVLQEIRTSTTNSDIQVSGRTFNRPREVSGSLSKVRLGWKKEWRNAKKMNYIH